MTEDIEKEILDACKPAHITGLSLLGGEPFEPSNQRALLPFLRRVREQFPKKTVWAFSGFTLEEMQREGSYVRCEVTDDLLALLDVLVDGPFVKSKKNLSLRFRGSENQRLIDVPASLAAGEIVLWQDWQAQGKGLRK